MCVQSGFSVFPSVSPFSPNDRLHVLFLPGDRLFSWGWNEHGMCGDGSLCDVMRPRPIPALRGARPVLIGCGAGHSMALCCMKDGEDCAAALAEGEIV